MFANEKVIFGDKFYTIGDVYNIQYPCNHHDFLVILKSSDYMSLYPGDKVELVDKIQKPEGIFARVRNIYTNIIYDIDYTNLGESANEQAERELEEERKRKEKRDN